MITVTSLAIQREIIIALPEIVTDGQHEHVAKALRLVLAGKRETMNLASALLVLDIVVVVASLRILVLTY